MLVDPEKYGNSLNNLVPTPTIIRGVMSCTHGLNTEYNQPNLLTFHSYIS